MAKNRTSTDCPVAALADEAQRLIDAHNEIDKKCIAEKNNPRFDAIAVVTMEALKGVLDRASRLQAESARGALFQLCAVADFLDILDADTVPERAAHRLLNSIASYIERTNAEGARLEDACGDYYLDRRFSSFECLREAQRLAEARKEAV